MAKSKLALGLDIGSSSVKLVQLKEAKRGYILEAFGVAELPPEAIVDGALMNSTAIVEAIRGLVAQYKLKNREAAIGVSGHSVIIKKISMPKMSGEELEESIQWEAEQYIPFDVKDVNIDVQILTPPEVDTGTGQMDVLLVAAKKDMINDYTSVVSEAGLTPVVVDVDAFAVQNSFEVNYELPKNETIVLVNAGASAKIPPLLKVIKQRVGVPVEILNPFKDIEVDNRRFDPNYVTDVAPSAAVAIGLALRKSHER